MKSELVYSALQCKLCKDVIESCFQHDFKMCSCHSIGLDSGIDTGYRRIIGNKENIEDLSVYSDEEHSKVRQFAFRTGFGQLCSKEYGVFKLTRIKDMSDDYLKSAIDYVEKFVKDYKDTAHYQILLNERGYRLENNIKIEEDV